MATMNAKMAMSFDKLRSNLQNIDDALLKDDLDSNVVESIVATFCEVRDELKLFLLKQHATYDLSVQHEKLWMFGCNRNTDVRSQEFNDHCMHTLTVIINTTDTIRAVQRSIKPHMDGFHFGFIGIQMMAMPQLVVIPPQVD